MSQTTGGEERGEGSHSEHSDCHGRTATAFIPAATQADAPGANAGSRQIAIDNGVVPSPGPSSTAPGANTCSRQPAIDSGVVPFPSGTTSAVRSEHE
jgi:hypothetical protein